MTDKQEQAFKKRLFKKFHRDTKAWLKAMKNDDRLEAYSVKTDIKNFQVNGNGEICYDAVLNVRMVPKITLDNVKVGFSEGYTPTDEIDRSNPPQGN